MKKKEYIHALAAVVLILMFGGCKGFGSPMTVSSHADIDYPVEFDGMVFSREPIRAVSLSAAAAEIIFDLGQGTHLAGRASSADYPAEVKKLPDCGTADDPDIDKILSLNPDLIITPKELMGEKATRIKFKNIAVVVVPDAHSLEELCKNYERLGTIFGGNFTGLSNGINISGQLMGRITEKSEAIRGTVKVFACYIGETGIPAMPDTFIGSLMSQAGALPIKFDESTGYVSEYELSCMEHIICPLGMAEIVETMPGIVDSPAALNGRIHEIDPSVLTRQGFRTADTVELLSQLIIDN
jgi:iron complex transport system substrate-binding protein